MLRFAAHAAAVLALAVTCGVLTGCQPSVADAGDPYAGSVTLPPTTAPAPLYATAQPNGSCHIGWGGQCEYPW